MDAEGHRRPGLVIAYSCMLGAVGFAAFIEIGIGACPPTHMYAWYALFWSVILIPLLVATRARGLVMAYAGFLIVLSLLHTTDWSSRKPFLRDLRRIEVGMTPEDVESIMGRYMIGTGWRLPASTTSGTGTPGETQPLDDQQLDAELQLDGAVVYRHSDEGAYNSDWGVVHFEDGCVVGTEFLAD
jgi:hypothetical protein